MTGCGCICINCRSRHWVTAKKLEIRSYFRRHLTSSASTIIGGKTVFLTLSDSVAARNVSRGDVYYVNFQILRLIQLRLSLFSWKQEILVFLKENYKGRPKVMLRLIRLTHKFKHLSFLERT